MKALLTATIKFYKSAVSPFFPNHCRFYPTCSQYALEAVETHGAFRGIILSVKRIAKCHPFHKGGFDSVPPKQTINITIKK